MSKQKQHLDDFLRDKLSTLPNAPVAGFEKVEARMAARSHRGIVLVLLIPFITLGLYWMSTFTEKDLLEPGGATPGYELPSEPHVQEDVPAPIEYQAPNLATEEAAKVPVQENRVASSKTEATLAIATAEAEVKNPTQIASISQIPKLPIPELDVDWSVEPNLNLAVLTDFNQTEQQDAVMAAPKAKVAFRLTEEQAALRVTDGEVAEAEAESAPELALRSTTETNQSATNQNAHVSVSTTDIEPIFSSPSPWEITANFYPNYTFREFKINPSYQSMVNPRYEDIISTSEKGGFGFNVGVAAKYRLAKDLFIGSGIGYIENKVNGRYTYNIYQEISATNNEPPVRVGKTEDFGAFTAIPVDQGIIQTYRYVQVPLHISYQPWATDRLRLIIEAGFSYLRFINADGTTVDYQTLVPTDLSTFDYTKNLGSFDFKVGVMYYTSKQVAFGVEPTLMYFNQSIFQEDAPLSVVPWSVGVNFNVRMRLL